MLTKASEAISSSRSRELGCPSENTNSHYHPNQSSTKVSEVTSRKNVFYCSTENVQIINFSETPTQILNGDWHVSILASVVHDYPLQTDQRRAQGAISNHQTVPALLQLNDHFTSVKAARRGGTMAWSWKERNKPADRHTGPAYTPLFSLASDILYGLKDWVGWGRGWGINLLQYSPRSTWRSGSQGERENKMLSRSRKTLRFSMEVTWPLLQFPLVLSASTRPIFKLPTEQF